MGICIALNISRAITKKEWEDVYEETVQLIKHFPLAERKEVNIHGVDTICLVKTQDREHIHRCNRKVYGWAADGDMDYMKIAEEYFLPKELVSGEAVDLQAGDAILGVLYACFDCNAYEKYLKNVLGMCRLSRSEQHLKKVLPGNLMWIL